jgi:hypothetical protein
MAVEASCGASMANRAGAFDRGQQAWTLEKKGGALGRRNGAYRRLAGGWQGLSGEAPGYDGVLAVQRGRANA